MLKNFLILIAISICWGLSIVFIKVEVTAECPFTVMAERSVIAFLFMLTVSLILRKDLRLTPNKAGAFMLLSCLGIIIPWIMLGFGQKLLNTSLASALNSTQVIFTYLIVVIITRSLSWSYSGITGIILGTLGLVVIIGLDTLTHDDSALSGVFIMAGGFLGFSIFGVMVPRLARGIDPVVSIVWLFGFAALVFAILAIILEEPFNKNLISYHTVSALALAIVSTAIPYWGYEVVLKRAGAFMGSMIAYFVPTFGIVFGVLMIGQSFELRHIAGILIIFTGVYFVNRAILKHKGES